MHPVPLERSPLERPSQSFLPLRIIHLGPGVRLAANAPAIHEVYQVCQSVSQCEQGQGRSMAGQQEHGGAAAAWRNGRAAGGCAAHGRGDRSAQAPHPLIPLQFPVPQCAWGPCVTGCDCGIPQLQRGAAPIHESWRAPLGERTRGERQGCGGPDHHCCSTHWLRWRSEGAMSSGGSLEDGRSRHRIGFETEFCRHRPLSTLGWEELRSVMR